MLSFFMIISIFIYKKYIPYELFLREAIPFYKSSFNAQVLFMLQTKKVFKDQKLNSKKNMAKQNIIIEVAIDIHRDGVADSVHLVENINNKPTAKIMFVGTICK